MVKVKRRRATPKVRRRVKNRSRFGNLPFTSTEVASRWEPMAGVRENYRRLGLVSNPNQIRPVGDDKPLRGDTEGDTGADPAEMFEIPDSDCLAEPRKGKHHMKAKEQEYIKRLIDKHGRDYTAMARDMRANPMQHTENHLRRRCARYMLLHATAEQRKVVREADEGASPAGGRRDVLEVLEDEMKRA